MVKIISSWFQRFFSHPEAVILFLSLLIAVAMLITMGRMFAPVIASVVIAYLLQSLVAKLEYYKLPRRLAVVIVYLAFISLLVLALLGLLPLLWHQLTNLFNEMPSIFARVQTLLTDLPARYPDYITLEQMKNILGNFRAEFASWGQTVLSATLAIIPNLVIIVIYFVLVPMLIYFFLMDRAIILNWCKRFLPQKRRLLVEVWDEVHEQIGNYVRGKAIEVILVGVTCYIVFALMGLPYAALLSALVGISVIVPYIGAVVVTVPIVIIALVQWGWTAHFAYLMLAYAIIVALDANVLVPVLFSEAVDLHPVAIIVAILFFGGLWGFWGVFFAIPLASLVKAVLTAWPNGEISHGNP